MSTLTNDTEHQIGSLTEALAALAKTAGEPAPAPPPPLPRSSADAIGNHVNAVIGRATHQAVERSRKLRRQLELMENTIIKDMADAHEAVGKHLLRGENLLRIADFIEEEFSGLLLSVPKVVDNADPPAGYQAAPETKGQ